MKKPSKTPQSSKERGQASIVIGMFILTFMLFFAFVVNTGMLVNAKINLQNAADLAAYSGAAVQARQLNTLAFINYEMRRQYKKFLFRYYVLGTMFQDSFPGNTHTPGNQWSPGQRQYIPGPVGVIGNTTTASNQQATPYPYPAVCVDLYQAPATNNSGPGASFSQEAYCRLQNLPKIAGSGQSSAGSTDQIQTTLDAELTAIEQIREGACNNLAAVNQTLLFYWLFSTLPEGPVINFSALPTSGPGAFNLSSLTVMADRVRYLASGLGLVPRELILWFRAQTLGGSGANGQPPGWLNQPAATVHQQDVTTLRSGVNAMRNERTINAFKSAYDTLGDSTWAPSSIQLEELLPTTLIDLTKLSANFTAYSVGYELDSQNNCSQKLYGLPVGGDLPLGFFKASTATTYYAVKLSAAANVLFAPWSGPLTLTAYSAAMPFGSRIGPTYPTGTNYQNLFTYGIDPTATAVYNPSAGSTPNFGTLPPFIPNLPMAKTDQDAGVGTGWNLNQVQHAYYTAVPQNGQGNRLEYDALLNLAMTPTPWEAGQYSIPNDLSGQGPSNPDPFVRWFDSNGEAALWAPLFDGAAAQVPGQLDQEINQFFGNNAGDISSAAGVGGAGKSPFPTPAALVTLVEDSMDEYAKRLVNKSGQTDGANNATQPPPGAIFEGVNIMPISDPFQVPPGIYSTVSAGAGTTTTVVGRLSPPYPITLGGAGSILPATIPGNLIVDRDNPNAAYTVRDAWDNVQDSTFIQPGRVGYSVKFVSFKSLTNNNAFPNQPTGDSDFKADWPLLQH